MEQLTAWVIRWNKMWFANVHSDVGPHLWAELKGLYMENKNGVKVVAKYDKIQARNFTLVLQCRTYENAEKMWKIVERCWKGDDSVWDSPPQAFQTHPRQPREVLPGAPSVWAQSGDQVWNMRFLWIFTLMRHRPNSKLYLVLNFPLQRGSHTLTTHSKWDYGESKLKDIIDKARERHQII